MVSPLQKRQEPGHPVFKLAGIARQEGMQLRGMDFRIEARGRWNRSGERRRSRIIARNPATASKVRWHQFVPGTPEPETVA